MSKRGSRQTFIFFYAYPFVGEEVVEKIKDLARIIGKYQKYSRLYVVPFGDIQKKIADKCWPEYRTLLFRWYMVKTAARLAERRHAFGLITGDALGQVSSQTLLNISAVDKATEMPILRPLIGFNKAEIIDVAGKIGTFETSILPHDDACSLLAPKRPKIKGSVEYIKKFDSDESLGPIIENILDEAQIFGISAVGTLEEIFSK